MGVKKPASAGVCCSCECQAGYLVSFNLSLMFFGVLYSISRSLTLHPYHIQARGTARTLQTRMIMEGSLNKAKATYTEPNAPINRGHSFSSAATRYKRRLNNKKAILVLMYLNIALVLFSNNDILSIFCLAIAWACLGYLLALRKAQG